MLHCGRNRIWERGEQRGKRNEVRRTIPCLPAGRSPAPERTAVGHLIACRRVPTCVGQSCYLALAPRLPLQGARIAGRGLPRCFFSAGGYGCGRMPLPSPTPCRACADPGTSVCGLAMPSVSCNKLNSEDRAIHAKSLILLRRTIHDLLHMANHVTECFSIVTTSANLWDESDAVNRWFCDRWASGRCDNVRRAARMCRANRLQK